MKKNFILILLALGLFITLLVTLAVGSVPIPISVIIKVLLSKVVGISQTWQVSHEEIILNVRLPRILLGIFVGCALSISGCAMQALFRNPMASPYVCGVAAGGAFGASLVIVLGVPQALVMPVAFFFSLLTIFLVYYLAETDRKLPVETLLLAGIALSLFFSALTSFIQYIAKEQELRQIVFWLMGGLWASDWGKVLSVFPIISLGVLCLLYFSRELNILLLGEESALDIGVEVESTRKIILILTALITASAVATCGVIGFVGLIIPHIMRIIIGPDHRFLLLASAISGSIFLVWADVFARTLIPSTELPVGIITALIGVPFFLFLLRRRKRLSGF